MERTYARALARGLAWLLDDGCVEDLESSSPVASAIVFSPALLSSTGCFTSTDSFVADRLFTHRAIAMIVKFAATSIALGR